MAYLKLDQLSADASWFGKTPYSKPLSSAADAAWATPAPGELLHAGFDGAEFGSHEIFNAQLVAAPSGIAAPSVPNPSIWNRSKFILVGGKSELSTGIPRVENLRRYISPTLGIQTKYGTTFVQGGIKQIVPAGIASSKYGTHWASFYQRIVAPASIGWNFFTSPTVGYSRSVSPSGFDAARFGERIVPESRNIYPGGFSGSYGDSWVSLGTRHIVPAGFKSHAAEAYRFGASTVWNWRQYRVIEGFSDGTFGVWTGIENRNKTITHHSTAPGHLPSPQVDNAARQLLPAAIPPKDLPAFERSGEVSYRHRSIAPYGLEAGTPSRWSTVFNDARILQPHGAQHSVFGVGSAWNNRRYLIKIGDFDAAKFGRPMVADGIRTIAFEERYTIGPVSISMPNVRLKTRYVEQAGGFDAFKTGGHALHIHWNIAYPRWVHNEALLAGLPSVRNVTPMLGQRGHDSAEFGGTAIRTQWRTVTPMELYAQVFGQVKVADRRQRIEPVAIGAFRLSDKLTVAKLQPDPPAKQWITIQPGQAIGYGPMQTYNDGRTYYPPQPTSDHGFGTLVMNAILIYPESIDPTMPSQFGQPSLIYMGINDVTVSRAVEHPGKPTVTYRNRRVVVERPPNYSGPPFGEHDAYGKPRLNPLTIWAVMDAPQQARDNHPVSNLHYVDFVPGFNGYWKKGMGEPSVSMLNRRVNASGQIATSYGAATVKNKTTFVSVIGERYSFVGKPKLLGFLRYITPSNNNAPGYIEHEFGGTLGLATISNSTRTVFPAGIASSNRIDKPVIDHFHRFIKPAGMNAGVVSSHSGYQYPYQWQKIRVGPLVPTVPSGTDMALFGTPWASNRVRGIDPDGFDAFAIGETFEEFDFRMRVKRVPEETRPFRLLRPATFGGNMVPHPYVRPAAHHILPDGNMDNFRKGAPDA